MYIVDDDDDVVSLVSDVRLDRFEEVGDVGMQRYRWWCRACHVDELMEKEWVGDVDGVGEIDDDDGGGGGDDDDNDDAGTMVQKM